MVAFREVKVAWRNKAFAFQVLDRIPFGERIYYFLQKNVTHTYPRKLAPTADTGAAQIRHIEFIGRFRKGLDRVTLLEIGAGWDLYANLIYYCLGVEAQIAIDIRRWARADAINAVIRHLQVDPPAGHVRVPTVHVAQNSLDADLNRAYGIAYRAPFDASATGFAAASVDLITTTSVFEHVPAPTCDTILAECRRVIRDDGLMSHVIDYSDHYAHADPDITSYNYLRFDDREWKSYNPGIHYQNRLRSAEFRSMFRAHGFEIVEEMEWVGPQEELDATPIHDQFKAIDRQDLRVLGGHFLLRPACGARGLDVEIAGEVI